MKTSFFSVRNGLLAVSALLASVAFTSCKDDDETPMNNNPYTLSGTGSGAQVVPAVSGTGSSSVSGTFDPANNRLIYTTSWAGLTGGPTGGGLYTGASGANGDLVGTAWSFEPTAPAAGSVTDTVVLTSAQSTQLTNGNLYYIIGTLSNPTGEVRGQFAVTR